MSILLQYNYAVTNSVAELMKATNIEESSLMQILQILLKAKVLISEESSSDPQDMELQQSSRLTLYTDYKKWVILFPLKIHPPF